MEDIQDRLKKISESNAALEREIDDRIDDLAGKYIYLEI